MKTNHEDSIKSTKKKRIIGILAGALAVIIIMLAFVLRRKKNRLLNKQMIHRL